MVKFSIKEVIDFCKKYTRKEMSETDFEKFLKSINIFRRLSMYQKSMLVSLAIMDFDDLNINFGIESDTSAEIEVIYVNRFITSYMDIKNEPFEIDAYDVEVMYSSGLIDYILDICERDFDIIKRMYENAIKLKYINILNSMLGDITNEQNEQNIKTISKVFEDKETINNVAKIVEFNDPSLKKVKEILYSAVEKGDLVED